MKIQGTTRLWTIFSFVVIVSFAVLGYYGYEIYQEAPPIPDRVVTTDGTTLFEKENIQNGQNVWQSIGGQEVGSIWGHGAYVAPDWTADWLHREALIMLNLLAQQKYNSSFEALPEEEQASLKITLQKDIRTNTFDKATRTLTLSENRAKAFNELRDYYSRLFNDDPALHELRDRYAIPERSIKDPQRREDLGAFFFWATWACVTNRPGEEISYTHNWPAEELVGNRPTGDLMLWTGFSVIMLLLGIGILVFYNARNQHDEVNDRIPEKDPLLNVVATPSMSAVIKYFWVVTALIVVQVIMGVIAAHYGVEGQAFYGF